MWLTSKFYFYFRSIANDVAVNFLYENKQFFIVYAFDKQDSTNLHVKKSVQRFQRCILHLFFRAAPALQAYAAKTYFNKDIQDSAKEMTQEVFNDLIRKLDTKIQIEDSKVKERLIENLKRIKISVMFPDEVLNDTIIENVYDDLDIDDSKSAIQIFLNLTLYNQRMNNERKSYWKKRLNTISEVYNVMLLKEENLLGKRIYEIFRSRLSVQSNETIFSCSHSMGTCILSLISPNETTVFQHGNVLYVRCRHDVHSN